VSEKAVPLFGGHPGGVPTYRDAVEELGAVAELLAIEAAEEAERMAAAITGAPMRVRRAEGLTWSPVEVEPGEGAVGGMASVVVRWRPGSGELQAFRAGAPVLLSAVDGSGEPRRGIVRSARPDELQVLLEGPPPSRNELHGSWTLDVRPDERSAKTMAWALSEWLNATSRERKTFRDGLLGYAELPEPLGPVGDGVELGELNGPQRAAVEAVLARPPLALLHGPPGTGKTTTLVAAIRGLVAGGEQVLATAPSNTAVDVLAAKCRDAGLRVVRIGHPARIDESLLASTVDALVESDPGYRQVRELRRRATDAFHNADRNRRSFDAGDRRDKRASRDEGRDLLREARATEAYLVDRVLREADVVCATLIGTADPLLGSLRFPVVVMDEAGQALEPAAWVALLRADRAVLAGDPQQLPPTVRSLEAARGGFDISLLEKCMDRHAEASGRSYLLSVQYRMHRAIMQPPSDAFYNGALEAAPAIAERGLPGLAPWVFIDTAGCGFEERREEGAESTSNPEEAAFVVARIAELLAAAPEASIGVVAPYRAQVQELNACIAQTGWSSADRARVEVSTVDSFQGQERDAMVLSLTRSNSDGEIGFLTEYRRTNVAMTRARMHLLMVGDSATLAADPFFAWLLDRAVADGAHRSAWDWM